jgi:hypothetical protein
MMSAIVLAALLSTMSGEASWVPWYGCFSLIEDEVRSPVFGEELDPGAESTREGLVCLTPDEGGVRVRTFSGDEAFLEEVLVADGTRQEVTKGSCRGWERLDWSKDGQRLYSHSELTCEGGRTRSVSGVSLIDDRSQWLELQSIGEGDARAVLLRRYRPASEDVSLAYAPELTLEVLRDAARARAEASVARLSIDDIIDASSRIEPDAVEAMLVERGGRFPIDRKRLLELSEASVPPRVIDLMVALSFPDHFAVSREPSYGGGGLGGGYSALYDPFYSSAFAHPYYYAPFGYYYWYAPWRPIQVVPPEGASGRVVAGQGYTRVRPIPSDERRTKGSSGSGWTGERDSSGSDGGTATSSGYSRGGSEGRTAKPKQNRKQ